jgi:ribosomal protein S18 acetylase RimI-like enzyme
VALLGYRITRETEKAEAAGQEILTRLLEFNASQAGDLNLERVVFSVRADDGALIGGLVAAQYWNGMFIDLLWVHEKLRRRGVGRELMQRAEALLTARGGEIVFLSTWSFQAPGFYEKLGYTAFGTLEGMPANGQRTWYFKRLK